ncbi:MAG: Fur family transcriptional regulator [bacterium]|nr:Fur family transcriptional regulator [bacterium]
MTAAQTSALLRAAGLRATPARIALLGALARAARPVSVPTLAQRLRGALDQATLYRALQQLTTAGIIRRVNLEHDHAHYEIASDDHHHLVCTGCGRVADVARCTVDRLAHRVLADATQFASIERHALEFFGTCTQCAARMQPSP